MVFDKQRALAFDVPLGEMSNVMMDEEEGTGVDGFGMGELLDTDISLTGMNEIASRVAGTRAGRPMADPDIKMRVIVYVTKGVLVESGRGVRVSSRLDCGGVSTVMDGVQRIWKHAKIELHYTCLDEEIASGPSSYVADILSPKVMASKDILRMAVKSLVHRKGYDGVIRVYALPFVGMYAELRGRGWFAVATNHENGSRVPLVPDPNDEAKTNLVAIVAREIGFQLGLRDEGKGLMAKKGYYLSEQEKLGAWRKAARLSSNLKYLMAGHGIK